MKEDIHIKNKYIITPLIILLFIITFYNFYKNIEISKNIEIKNNEIISLKNSLNENYINIYNLKNNLFLLKNLNYPSNLEDINKKIVNLEKKIDKSIHISKNTSQKLASDMKKSIAKYEKNTKIKNANLGKDFLKLKTYLISLEKNIDKNEDIILKNRIIAKGQTESEALPINKEHYKVLKKISKIEKEIISISDKKKNNNVNYISSKNKTEFYKENNSYLFKYNKNESVKLLEKIKKPNLLEVVKVKPGSFPQRIRNFPIKKKSNGVFSLSGKKIWPDYRVSGILNIDVWKNQECADSAMRLWGEYSYAKNDLDKIKFKLENGDENPIFIKNLDRESFKKHFLYQFSYSSSHTLKRDLKSIKKDEVLPGDLIVLRKYGSKTGHVYVIMEVAKSKIDGKIKVVFAQGNIPTQDFHILKNKPFNKGYKAYKDEFTEKNITAQIFLNLKASLFQFFEGGFFSTNLTKDRKEDFSSYNAWFDLDTFLKYAEKNDPNGKPYLKRFY